MTESNKDRLRRQIEEQTRRVQSSLHALYTQDDPSGDDESHTRLLEDQAKLQQLQQQ